MLVLAGEMASGPFLVEQARLVANDVRGAIILGSGHWLIDEAPEETIRRIIEFVGDGGAGDSRANVELMLRLTPLEIRERDQAGAGAGTSGVAGIRTVNLSGDPLRQELYTIQLHVPPNTRIESHRHPDDRVAVVISGTWYFGYGDEFDEASLKPLPPTSYYTEPAGVSHFARTSDSPVVLQISGYGPTGTRYVEH
jgi:quercetin dioxygenase-like cupin family protein